MNARATPIDYDLHGIVGIRLIGATTGDARAVAAQLGPFRQRLTREPDIVVRFVERLLPGQKLRLLGASEAGFTDDVFLLLRSRYHARARVQIPFPELGGRCEVVCESGLPAVSLLIAIVNLTALAHGFVPLHASAFTFEGRGILVTGWSKGGKTEALLAFMQRGAEYLGDEWIYLDPERGRMFGIPQPIRLWDWHLRQLPIYRQGLGRVSRARLAAIAFAVSTLDLAGRATPRGSSAHRIYERFREIVRRQAHVDAAPEALFGTLGPLAAPLDRVVLVASDETAGISVEPMDPRLLARRMEFSVRYEFAPLLSHYDMFRFAFPDSENPWIESMPERLGPLLARALAGKPTLAVRHPYPFELAALFEAMRPFVAGA